MAEIRQHCVCGSNLFEITYDDRAHGFNVSCHDCGRSIDDLRSSPDDLRNDETNDSGPVAPSPWGDHPEPDDPDRDRMDDAELASAHKCLACGMLADVDPELHRTRYGHRPKYADETGRVFVWFAGRWAEKLDETAPGGAR